MSGQSGNSGSEKDWSAVIWCANKDFQDFAENCALVGGWLCMEMFEKDVMDKLSLDDKAEIGRQFLLSIRNNAISARTIRQPER